MELRPIVERQAKSNASIHEHPLLNRVYQNRGITDPEEINYSLGKLIHPMKMKGVSEAADLLIKHILAGSKIVVIGDYDCDGATSTTIAVEGLTMCGANAVEFQVPDRLTQGYGLSPAVVSDVVHMKPDLIVTVDNGISSMEGVQAAKDLGCDVLVTDHHLTADGGILPNADVIVNPQQPGCNFPSKNIAGCGVIFNVIAGLRIRMREQGVFGILGIKKEPNIGTLIDVLGLGTVADVVDLDENNRHIVAASIKYIREGRARPLIYQLLALAGKDYRKFNVEDFGFTLGPRINAAGRLSTMDLSIRGFLAKNEHESWKIAQQLDDTNKLRKEMSADHEQEANDIMDSENISSDANGVCLYGPDWHEGVVGILAGRVKEKLNRPAICLTMTHETAMPIEASRSVRAGNYVDAERSLIEAQDKIKELTVKDLIRKNLVSTTNTDEIPNELFASNSKAFESLEELIGMVRKGVKPSTFSEHVDTHVKIHGEIKGSCRSVEGIHLKHVLDHINKSHAEVLNKFGGHAMAAGVTVRLNHFEKFKKIFDEMVSKDLTDEVKAGKVMVDGIDLPPEMITLENAEILSNAGPWGKAFEPPTFSGKFELVQLRPLQNKHLKMTVRVPGTQRTFDAIAFNKIDRGFIPVKQGNTIDLVYKMDVNEFNGRRSVQLMVELAQDPELLNELKEAQKFKDDENTQGDLVGVIDDQKKKNETFRQSKMATPEPSI